jgi:hypothetical protein
VAYVVAARGYGKTRVVDVIGTAGVSRKTFYELFDSKEDCFLAPTTSCSGQLLEAPGARLPDRPSFPRRRPGGRGGGARASRLSTGRTESAHRDRSFQPIQGFMECEPVV